MSATKEVKFQDTGDGHADVLRNRTAQAPAQHGVFGLSQPETPPQPSHAHSHRDTPATLTISHQKAYRQPSPIAEEGGDWDIHRRSTDVDQIMPYTYSSSVLWDSWISDFNDDDDSSDEPQTETTIIQDIYIDPLDQCMEGIEDLATGILRTGKLGLQGEPGDMTKIQPVMFGLEPLAKDMPQLLPQLLKVPLFHQVDQDTYCVFDDDTPLEDFLATGHIRLGVPIDTIIYYLLRGHCAKGAKQAEELIRTAQNIGSKLHTPQTTMPLMPPIIFSSALARKTSCEKRGNGRWDRCTTDRPFDESDVVEFNPLPQGLAASKTANMLSDSSVSSIPSTDRSRDNSSTQQQLSLAISKIANTPSSSSVSTTYSTGKSRNTSSASILSSTTSSSSLTEEVVDQREQSTLTPITEVQAELGDGDKTKPQHSEIASKKQQTRQRKDSKALKRPVVRTVSSSSAEFSGDDHEEKKPVADKNQWNVSFLDNTMVVAMYGKTTYPLLMWNPKLKVDFQLSSSIGLLDGAITGIDSTKPAVTVKVTNDSPYRIGFSISVHRQSTVFQPHVLHPTKGLHVLEQEQSWEDNAGFYCNPKSKEMNEYFVLDLFVSTLDGNASWNILRKYAVMKAHKSPSSAPGSRRGSSAPGSRRGSRRPSRKFTQFQMPGNFDQKEENLKLIISHGLQCVVKSKLEEAEIIFTQALHLPDFQRVPIKAFVYICLAIIANKRKKIGDTTSLIPVLTMFNGATQLVEVYESTPGVVKMPRMLQLVKQLKKELDIKKIISQCKHNRRSRRSRLQEKSREESDTLTPEGGTLYYNSTVITVPPDALKTATKITISKPDKKQLDSMLHSTGWDNTVQIVTAMHLQCNMAADHFEKPITVQSSLPEPLLIGSKSVIRLLQSNYLRHWQDITDDLHSQVSVSGNQVHISTDRMGWLAVTLVQLDVSKIAQMAMKSLSIDPVVLHFSVCSQTYPDDVIQIAVFVVPCKANGEPLHQEDLKPQHHVPIAFPHTVQAWPGERLQLALQGNFAPDASAGQKDLNYEFEVQQTHNRICEKWVKLTSESDQLLSGKLTVSRFCQREGEVWESITEMNLSNRNGRYSPESSSSDTHQS